MRITAAKQKKTVSNKVRDGVAAGRRPPGADNGNRTRLVGLGSRSSTDKLCPQILYIIHYAAGFVNIIIDNF